MSGPHRPGRPHGPVGGAPSPRCADGPPAPTHRRPDPSDASTSGDGGTDRRAPEGPGPRTTAATGAPLGATRRTGAPLPPLPLHLGSPRPLPGTSAPRHSAPPTCSGVCRGSGGASVTHQARPRHPSGEADESRIRRDQTILWSRSGESNPGPTHYECVALPTELLRRPGHCSEGTPRARAPGQRRQLQEQPLKDEPRVQVRLVGHVRPGLLHRSHRPRRGRRAPLTPR